MSGVFKWYVTVCIQSFLKFGFFIFGGRHAREFAACETTNLAKRHLAGHEKTYKFGKAALDKYIPPPKTSRNAPPGFHKLMFGGGMAEKCRECQIMIWAFGDLVGRVVGNALPNYKIVM